MKNLTAASFKLHPWTSLGIYLPSVDTGSISSLGRLHISRGNSAHVPQLLRAHSLEHGLQLLSLSMHTLEQEYPLQEARALQLEEPSQAATKESPHTAMRIQHSKKQVKKIF